MCVVHSLCLIFKTALMLFYFLARQQQTFPMCLIPTSFSYSSLLTHSSLVKSLRIVEKIPWALRIHKDPKRSKNPIKISFVHVLVLKLLESKIFLPSHPQQNVFLP